MSATDHATGLTPQQVEESRSLHGRNILTPAAREPLWKKFLHKFSDPLIIILLVAGALSVSIAVYEHMVLGEGAGVFFEPAGIFMAILLATGLGFYFEVKADREFAILNKVNDDEPVRVVRDGNTVEIPKSEIVVGDVVMVNTGDEVPADGKLLKSVALSVDESSLTGEPVARKTTEKEHFDPDATFPSDMLLRGSKVMEGYGVMCVTRVGDATEIGKVHEAAMIDDSVKTPLNEQLERLGRLISIGSYVIAAIIMAGRILMYLTQPGFTFEWVGFLTYMLQTVMIAVTLIVVAVPEGLPMAVTLSLAYSMRRMLKTNNLVRKMHACETMGAATVICTDKTGTLTQNKMQVTETFFPDIDNEVVRHDVEEGVAVNSTATLDLSDPATPKALGNPTEGALLLWLHGSGRDYMRMREETEIADQLPFTTENKYMATLVRQADGSGILYLKGAPEIVYSMCDDNGGIGKESLDSRLLDWQNRAMRTLGFAVARTAPGQTVFADGKVCTGGLRFLGITAIMDPVREDVPQAVDEVLHAGIKIKIVTGDTPGTAKEIGRRIGLWDDATDSERNIITGTEFEALGDDELKERVEDLKIIARARPMDKKRLVESLQGLGEVVAVTGDGTNDAPALKSAHVGLSMGDGTSVAKDASDITIVDNSFSSIGRAVMWGRSLYRNIQRFILFQLTVNVVACLIVMSGAFMGLQSPLTVTQMLWVNLIMDTFAAIALASLPPSEAVMDENPRPRQAFIITGPMTRFICGIGGLFFILLFGFMWYLEHTDLTTLSQIGSLPILKANKGLSPYELSLFFTTFVFLQFWNLFNARAFATGRSAFHFKGCNGFLNIVLLILIGQVAIVELGGAFFNVTPLRLSDWLIIIASTSAVVWTGEIMRLSTRLTRRAQ